MSDIPLAVHCEEVIVRGICHPFHLKKNGSLDWNAFRPPPARKDVSVIRRDYTGTDFCKSKAKALTDPDKKKYYCGLAFFRAGSARAVGADVVDTRHIYLGHADVEHECSAPPRGEPPPPGELDTLRNACKKLVTASRFVRDSAPDGEDWREPEVTLPACGDCESD